jgi:hypothetical protein
MSAAIEAVIEASSWINETEEGQKALKSEIASVATQLARSTFGLDGAPGESAMEARDVQHGR